MNHLPCGDQMDECCIIVNRLRERIKNIELTLKEDDFSMNLPLTLNVLKQILGEEK